MHLYGQMGHKGQVLEIGRGRRRRIEFCICVAPAPRPALLPRGTHLTLDGMGGITSIFLLGIVLGRQANLKESLESNELAT